MEMNEVDFEEAKKMIAEAKAKGRFVVNKKRGELIEDLKPDVEELLVLELIEIVEGG